MPAGPVSQQEMGQSCLHLAVAFAVPGESPPSGLLSLTQEKENLWRASSLDMAGQ